MLDARAGVEDDVLLDLGLLLARGGLVDGHLDEVVGRGHDDGVEGRELGADLGVVDGPEAVEGQALLVKSTSRDHFVPRLVADAVVDAGKGHVGHRHGRGALFAGAEAGQEWSSVAPAVDESVSSIAVGADDSGSDGAVVILGGGWALDGDGALSHGLVVYGLDVVNLKGHVLDGIAVSLEVSVNLLQELPLRIRDGLIFREVSLRSQGRREDEADAIVADDIRSEISASSLESTVSRGLKAKEGSIISGRLLGVANPPRYVVIAGEVGGRLDSEVVGGGAVVVCRSLLWGVADSRRGHCHSEGIWG